jgi:hypothetical protein
VNEEARKRNGNLPGMGGVFNHVNLHAYHYAGNNPVKYTDPDGEITGWHIVGGLTIVGGVAVAVVGIVLSGGSGIIQSLQLGGEIVAYGIGAIALGEAIEKEQQSHSQALTDKAKASAPAPSQPPQNDDNNDKKSNMKHLSEDEINDRTGRSVHDVKNDIRIDYSKELRKKGIENFDIYENDGKLILKGNYNNRELLLDISLEFYGK